MAPHMDFDMDDAPSADMHELGPTFTLGGEEFRCLPIVPPGLIGDIMLSIVKGADGAYQRDIARTISTIGAMLVDRVWVADDTEAGGHWDPADDAARWHALMVSKERLVEAHKISNVFDWILKAYSEMNARPTSPSSP